MPDILIFDDDVTTLKLLSRLMKNDGYKVQEVTTMEACREALEEDTFKVLFADFSGSFDITQEFVSSIRQAYPAMPVIMALPRTVLTEKKLASSSRTITYLEKPFRMGSLMPTILKVFETGEQPASQQTVAIPVQMSIVRQFAGLIAQSEAMQKVVSLLERIAPLEVAVLIYGEKGTDKELLANALHQRSRRKERRFLAFNCGACPAGDQERELLGADGTAKQSGLIKDAEGGSLFLDEIETLSLELQRKLAELLPQKNQANIRLIAGAGGGPRELLEKGMDPGLQRTLSVVAIPIKPLRERREDILPLAVEILRTLAGAKQTPAELNAAAMSAVQNYAWPENYTELSRVLRAAAETAMANQQKITLDLLPEPIRKAARL